MSLRIKLKKRLPSRRLSITLPGELHAKLELYQRLLGDEVRTNDVIAEALSICFNADKAFRKAWEEESARRDAGLAENRRQPQGLSGSPHG